MVFVDGAGGGEAFPGSADRAELGAGVAGMMTEDGMSVVEVGRPVGAGVAVEIGLKSPDGHSDVVLVEVKLRNHTGPETRQFPARTVSSHPPISDVLSEQQVPANLCVEINDGQSDGEEICACSPVDIVV